MGNLHLPEPDGKWVDSDGVVRQYADGRVISKARYESWLPDIAEHRHNGATIESSRGDIVFSARALPDPDRIVLSMSHGEWLPGETVSIGALLSYLSFLELVAINERIIGLDLNVFEGIAEDRRHSALFDAAFKMYSVGNYHVGLKADLYQLLYDHEVFEVANLEPNDASNLLDEAHKRVEPVYRRQLSEFEDYLRAVRRRNSRNRELLALTTRLWFEDKIATPFAIQQLAHQGGLPHVLA